MRPGGRETEINATPPKTTAVEQEGVKTGGKSFVCSFVLCFVRTFDSFGTINMKAMLILFQRHIFLCAHFLSGDTGVPIGDRTTGTAPSIWTEIQTESFFRWTVIQTER